MNCNDDLEHKKPSIYVASGLSNHAKAREIIKHFQSNGYSITYDWTEHGESEAPTDQLKSIALCEINGVLSCDIFLMIHPAFLGSHVELGIALGCIFNNIKKEILILQESNQEVANKSFYKLDEINIYSTLDEIVDHISRLETDR